MHTAVPRAGPHPQQESRGPRAAWCEEATSTPWSFSQNPPPPPQSDQEKDVDKPQRGKSAQSPPSTPQNHQGHPNQGHVREATAPRSLRSRDNCLLCGILEPKRNERRKDPRVRWGHGSAATCRSWVPDCDRCATLTGMSPRELGAGIFAVTV